MRPFSHLLRRVVLALALSTVLVMAGPARAASEKYWVNIVFERSELLDDTTWESTWQQFRDNFLPALNAGLTDGSEFRIHVYGDRANFYLVDATTTNFAATYQSLRSIPSMIPPDPYLTIFVEGPFRGSPPPLADLSINGRGRNDGNTRIKTRVGRRPYPIQCGVSNRLGEFLAYELGMSGTVFNRRYCDFKVRDYTGRNIYAWLKSGRTITPTVNAPGVVYGRVAVGRSCQLRVRTNGGFDIPAYPIEISTARDGCVVNFSKIK